jgi:hypothetical protein
VTLILRADREVFARMRNGDVARLVRMLDFPLIAFAANTLPTIGSLRNFRQAGWDWR